MIDFIKQLLKYRYWLIPIAFSGIVMGMWDMPMPHNPVLYDLIIWLFIFLIIVTIFTFVQAFIKFLDDK